MTPIRAADAGKGQSLAICQGDPGDRVLQRGPQRHGGERTATGSFGEACRAAE